MVVKFNRTGTELFLEKLRIVSEGGVLSEDDINDIMGNRIIDLWLKAYESWIPSARGEFEQILKCLHTDSSDKLSEWGLQIDWGLRQAITTLETMTANLAFLAEFNWAQAEWMALKYLPRNTPISIDVFPTIDGFNGGMFRPGKVFISVLFVVPQLLGASGFSHEFHHSGFEYWWKANPLVRQYLKDSSTREYWVLRLHEYVVSEGIANAFCSPSSITKVSGKSDMILAHNEIITEYEEKMDEFFAMLESLVQRITTGSIEGIDQAFNELSLDMSGRGHPIGHFLSGRMVMEMDRAESIQRSDIIELVRFPLRFFELYSKAAKERSAPELSKETMIALDALISQMMQGVE